MLSEQAKVGLDRIFAQAAKSTLLVDSDDRLEIEVSRGVSEMRDESGDSGKTSAKEKKVGPFIVLTIASYNFRLLVLFHLDVDPVSRQYFTSGNPTRGLGEALSELGNLCCGAMKRELGKHFPHTGMSTPYILEGKCLAFLDELEPTHTSRQRIVINDDISLHAALCLCAYTPIDFRVEAAAAVEQTGMLELF